MTSAFSSEPASLFFAPSRPVLRGSRVAGSTMYFPSHSAYPRITEIFPFYRGDGTNSPSILRALHPHAYLEQSPSIHSPALNVSPAISDANVMDLLLSNEAMASYPRRSPMSSCNASIWTVNCCLSRLKCLGWGKTSRRKAVASPPFDEDSFQQPLALAAVDIVPSFFCMPRPAAPHDVEGAFLMSRNTITASQGTTPAPADVDPSVCVAAHVAPASLGAVTHTFRNLVSTQNALEGGAQ
ncbi:hypothetical protein BDZ89DRAFT_1144674 [Hymenopellis radicata]|nr:hypothetical protein BDZ89DRAFT_1144674 [Hymenopellis radicata]